jgi:hypothetical protein
MKKIILWTVGIIAGLALLVFWIFWYIVNYQIETPKDNDIIQRNLDAQKNQAQY